MAVSTLGIACRAPLNLVNVAQGPFSIIQRKFTFMEFVVKEVRFNKFSAC